MKIKQFYDEALSQASYAVESNRQIAIIDPARDPKPYYDYAKEHNAKIVAVVETHPHADFVSGHLEIHEDTGAPIYTSKKANASYPHKPFDDGDQLQIGDIKLEAKNTPGHSPDSISILLIDEDNRRHSVFTGDTLFVGDVGRPDLREDIQNKESLRESMAEKLYESTRNFFMKLEREVMIYPAHGPGSLCGKNIGGDLTSTIGHELNENYALKENMTKDQFVEELLKDQPQIPKYFKYDVELNKKGAPKLNESILNIPRITEAGEMIEGVLVVDTRDQMKFKNKHIHGSVNIMNGPNFETWLGGIVAPEEKFYLIADAPNKLDEVIKRAAKIGYEKNIKGALVISDPGIEHSKFVNLEHFKANPDAYRIIDVRSEQEVENNGRYFQNSINIPLFNIREEVENISIDKPLMVHCSGGFRSAAAYSIIKGKLAKADVYDLSEAIKEFKPKKL